jgi:hypothetical protein
MGLACGASRGGESCAKATLVLATLHANRAMNEARRHFRTKADSFREGTFNPADSMLDTAMSVAKEKQQTSVSTTYDNSEPCRKALCPMSTYKMTCRYSSIF